MPIIKRNSVRVTDKPSIPTPAAGSRGACAPTTGAKLIRADGVVRAIEVTCACGEVTVLELDYDTEPDQAPTDA